MTGRFGTYRPPLMMVRLSDDVMSICGPVFMMQQNIIINLLGRFHLV